MAIQVVFYKFGKKINSTKRPDAETGSVTYSCNMLDDCSIINPKISIVGANNTFNPSQYNYAYIASYDSRYYFVSDWTYSQGLWIASLTEDVLASWRGTIGTSTQYILRSSNSFDAFIADGNYPTKTGYLSQETSAKENPFVTSFINGCFVIEILGVTDSTTLTGGMATCYCMDFAAFQTFVNALFNDDSLLTQAVNGLLNPIDYVVNCYWCPVSYANMPGSEVQTDFRFGWWALPGNFPHKKIDVTGLQKTFELEFIIPHHTQRTSIGQWLDGEPYTRRVFFWPPIGIIPLDCSIVKQSTSIIATFQFDIPSGAATYKIETDGGIVINSGNCSFAAPILISQNSNEILNTIASTSSNLMYSMASGDFSNFVGNAISGISNCLPTTDKTGSIGSVSAFVNTRPTIRTDFLAITGVDNTTYGRPLYSARKISDIPGYIQTGNAHIEIAATDQEADKIISFMNGGFYYE